MNNYGAQDMVSSLKRVLMKKPQNFMSKVNLKKWNYGDYALNYENTHIFRFFHEKVDFLDV